MVNLFVLLVQKTKSLMSYGNNKAWKHSITAVCSSCHCEFYYNSKDIEHNCMEVFGTYIETEYVRCPECNDNITIKEIYA